MATIKIKFRTSSVKTKEGVLFYQIIHARVTGKSIPAIKFFLQNGISIWLASFFRTIMT